MSEWSQSLENISESSLLISLPENTLVRFYCPIPATCIKRIAGIDIGQTVLIEGIYQEKSNQLLYLINTMKLPHHNFEILT